MKKVEFVRSNSNCSLPPKKRSFEYYEAPLSFHSFQKSLTGRSSSFQITTSVVTHSAPHSQPSCSKAAPCRPSTPHPKSNMEVLLPNKISPESHPSNESSPVDSPDQISPVHKDFIESRTSNESSPDSTFLNELNHALSCFIDYRLETEVKYAKQLSHKDWPAYFEVDLKTPVASLQNKSDLLREIAAHFKRLLAQHKRRISIPKPESTFDDLADLYVSEEESPDVVKDQVEKERQGTDKDRKIPKISRRLDKEYEENDIMPSRPSVSDERSLFKLTPEMIASVGLTPSSGGSIRIDHQPETDTMISPTAELRNKTFQQFERPKPKRRSFFGKVWGVEACFGCCGSVSTNSLGQSANLNNW